MAPKPRASIAPKSPVKRAVKAPAPPPEAPVEEEVVEVEAAPVLRPYQKPDVVAPEPVVEEITYPVVYGNPRIPDEQFYVAGSPYRKRFINGVFIANDETEDNAVRAALAAHGRDKAEKWRGVDRKEWVHKKTGFRCFSDAVKDDYEHFHGQ